MGNGFKKLKVWSEATSIAVEVYRLCAIGRLSQDFGLSDQMRRSAVSVASNIAEGDERDTDKDCIRFFFFAKGSVAELRTQLEIASRVELITHQQFELIETRCEALGKMLGALIKARSVN